MAIKSWHLIQASSLLYVKYNEVEYRECLCNKLRGNTNTAFPEMSKGRNGLRVASVVSPFKILLQDRLQVPGNGKRQYSVAQKPC